MNIQLPYLDETRRSNRCEINLISARGISFEIAIVFIPKNNALKQKLLLASFQ